MRAVVVDREDPLGLRLAAVEEPAPGAHEALVAVRALSLNAGEIRRAFSTAEPGWRPGWDFAGVVEKAAADGSGPPEGAHVVGFLQEGSWAERVAVEIRALAVLPEAVTFAQAATLPVAGLTALFALREGGLLLGRRVLVNGASGGVGHFAVQIARASGAYVVGAVRRQSRRKVVEADGAHEAVLAEDLKEAADFGPYDLILESVGGEALAQAIGLLAVGGTCVTFGSATTEPTVLAPRAIYPRGVRVVGLIILNTLRHEDPSEGLSRLAWAVAEGVIRPRIEVEEPWDKVGEVVAAFLRREITGKAVLQVG